MLGKIATTAAFVVTVSLGVGAWSYAPSADKKPWRPQATATQVSMPAEQFAVPKVKAVPIALIGQRTPAKTAVASR